MYVDSSKTSGTHDGTSWATAYTNLQDALTALKNCTDSKQMWIAKGTYYPDEGGGETDGDKTGTFQLKNNLAIYGGFAGNETTLTDRNYTANVTVLNGDIDKNNKLDNNNAYTVVTGSGTDNTAVLDGFTVSGGYAPNEGGGMRNDSGSPVVSNCIFTGSAAESLGGGGCITREFQIL